MDLSDRYFEIVLVLISLFGSIIVDKYIKPYMPEPKTIGVFFKSLGWIMLHYGFTVILLVLVFNNWKGDKNQIFYTCYGFAILASRTNFHVLRGYNHAIILILLNIKKNSLTFHVRMKALKKLKKQS